MKILIEESVLRQALKIICKPSMHEHFPPIELLEVIDELRTALDDAENVEPRALDINSMDAVVWAKAFAERFTVWSQEHGVESDTFGLMVGWFANAIMAGYDEATRRNPAPAVPEEEPTYGQLKIRLEKANKTIEMQREELFRLRSAAQTPPTNTEKHTVCISKPIDPFNWNTTNTSDSELRAKVEVYRDAILKLDHALKIAYPQGCTNQEASALWNDARKMTGMYYLETIE